MGAPPLFWWQGLDQPLCFQASDSAIEGPRSQVDTCKSFDILHDGIPMLGTACQACQDENGWVRKSAQIERIHTRYLQLLDVRSALYRQTYYFERSIQDEAMICQHPCGRFSGFPNPRRAALGCTRETSPRPAGSSQLYYLSHQSACGAI